MVWAIDQLMNVRQRVTHVQLRKVIILYTFCRCCRSYSLKKIRRCRGFFFLKKVPSVAGQGITVGQAPATRVFRLWLSKGSIHSRAICIHNNRYAPASSHCQHACSDYWFFVMKTCICAHVQLDICYMQLDQSQSVYHTGAGGGSAVPRPIQTSAAVPPHAYRQPQVSQHSFAHFSYCGLSHLEWEGSDPVL